ncbi:MAG: pectinesterase family protein [Verrucomicrobia bacterium]|nr:pectinesterase family protein [Verrucomicrobiota bacterium]
MTPLVRFALLAALLSAPDLFGKDWVVAADGSGDFKSIQAAVDAVPNGSASRTTILVRKGTYAELVVVAREKKNLTLRGEDRQGTVIAATNNAALNPRRREMFSAEADDFILENLTLHNTTPKGGTQAEAIRVHADRVVLRHCDFRSFQDTLRLDGRVYVRDCYVEGDVDYVWGGGTVYFDRCTFHSVYNGYLVQSRNGADTPGYVFVDCRLTGASNIERYVLARIEPIRFPHSHVAFIDCAMGSHILPVGWQLDKAPGASAPGPAPQIRFLEYHSVDLAGKPLDVGGRLPASRQIGADEAADLRNVGKVLGGWAPPRD